MRIDTNLVEAIYSAATNAEAWLEVMNHFSSAIRADGCNLLFFDLESGDASFVNSTLDSPECIQLYAEQYTHEDLFRTIEHQPIGQAYIGSELIGYRELTDSKIYQEFLEPRQRHHFIGAIFMMDGPWSGVLSSFRGPKQQAFTHKEKLLVQPYIKHLNRAFIISNQLARQKSIVDATATQHDSLSMGVVMFNRQAKVVSLNAKAESIIGQNPLNIVDQRLQATDVRFNRQLQKLIHDSIHSRLDSINPEGGVLTLARKDQRALRLMITPFRSAEQMSDVFGVQVYCTVFLHAPDFISRPSLETFAKLYGLTTRQLEVCEGVVMGKNLHEIAEQLMVERDTVKQHLKLVYEKTRTKKQTELVRLICSVSG